MFSSYLQQQMLNVLVAAGTITVKLFYSNGLTEVPSGIGYAAQTTTFTVDTGTFPLVARNATAVTFPQATSDWPLVTHVGLFDGAGHLLVKQPLNIPTRLTAGSYWPTMNIGAMGVSIG